MKTLHHEFARVVGKLALKDQPEAIRASRRAGGCVFQQWNGSAA
jgi:hypothetical protein